MSANMARRRSAKASRRKKKLEQRRRSTAPTALAERVRRLVSAPLHACLVQEGLFEGGIGQLALVRRSPGGGLAAAIFLVDVFCLGVKDTIFREGSFEEITTWLEISANAAAWAPIEPADARKLLRDAVAYARNLGLPPHGDYAALDHYFGDISADTSTASFQFGCEGRPMYMPGPYDSPTKIRRLTEQLRRRLGDAGFDVDPDNDYGQEFDTASELPYDPDVAPDAKEWLARDESDRIAIVVDYQDADEELADVAAHASVHVAVENQLAEGFEPAVRAVARLMSEGLDRHDAIHAVGQVLMEMFYDALKSNVADATLSQQAYADALNDLTAEAWLASAPADEESEP